MLKEAFSELESQFTGVLEYAAPLSKFAYYRIGGKAELIATPRTFGDLLLLHALIQKTQCRYFILGWGSNLLFSDSGFPGLVIRMKHLFAELEEVSDEVVKVGGSLGAASLLKIAALKGYGGFAKLTGIPGSVGGMIAMNAGTHLGEIGTSVVKVEYVNLDREGELQIQSCMPGASDFSYRHNHFLKPGDLVTHAYLKYASEPKAQVEAEVNELYQRRKSTQPVDYPSCGSVFMNPKKSGLQAWQIIDQLGLRGHKIGQAQISEKHSNFIINLGGATAKDVKNLIDLVKARAQSELQVEMQEEVKIIS